MPRAKAPPKKRGALANPEIAEELEQSETLNENSPEDQDDLPPDDLSEDEDPEIENVRLRRQLQQAREIIAALQRSASVTPAPVPEPIYREPRVNKPTPFSGKLSEYHTFISQCLLTFSMCPITYHKDEQKVFFVISYLAGNARDWARPILENENHPYRESFSTFKQALDNLYADRNLKQRAMDKLGSLAQTKSCAAYAAEFEHVVAPLELDGKAKRPMFYRGLHVDIKKALVYFPEIAIYEDFVKQCISIDQSNYHLRKEEKLTANSPAKSSKRPHDDSRQPDTPFKKRYTTGNSDRPSQPSHSNQSNTSKPKPNSSRPQVSEEERERRLKENLCFRCGKSNHISKNCPLNKESASNAVAAPTPAPEYSSPVLPQENWLSQVTMRPVP